MRKLLAVAVLVLLTAAPDARAGAFKDSDVLASASNGIAAGPDGNMWVAEEFANSVARVSPAGQVVDRFAVGGAPVALAAGPGSTVWATVPSEEKLVKFTAAGGTPTMQDISTGAAPLCGPVAIVNGGNGKMYFSMPGGDGCTQPNELGFVTASTGTGLSRLSGYGQVFDLAIFGGKLFAPDYAGDGVQRVDLGDALTEETTVNMPAGSLPDGVAVSAAGTVTVSLNASGHIARYPAAQNAGSATELTPLGGTLTAPFGVAVGEGGAYVAGSNATVAFVSTAGEFTFFPAPAGSGPFRVVNGTDDDFWVSDRLRTRVMRFVDTAPRTTGVAATPASATSAQFDASLDTRGNATTYQFVYTGGTTAPVEVPASAAGPGPVAAEVTGLTPGTTYSVRITATNAKGTVQSAESSFATPAVAPPPTPTPTPTPKITAKVNFKTKVKKRRTRIRKLTITGLQGGETAKVTCTGKGCPFESRTIPNLAAGKRSLTQLFKGAKLKPKAKVAVRLSLTGAKSQTTTLTARKKSPRIRRPAQQ